MVTQNYITDLQTYLPLLLSGPRPGLCGLGSPLWSTWPRYVAPPAEPRGHLGPLVCPSHWPQNRSAPGREYAVTWSYQTRVCDFTPNGLSFRERRWYSMYIMVNLTSAVGRCGWAALYLSVLSLGPAPSVSFLIQHQPSQVSETPTTVKKHNWERWI